MNPTSMNPTNTSPSGTASGGGRSLRRPRRAVVAGLVSAAGAAGAGTIAAGWARAGARAGNPAASAGRRLPAVRPLTYVAIGASDAVGYGLAAPRRDGWVPLLARELPQPVRLVNLGVPGSTLRQAIEQQLPRAIEAQPHLVTVWLVVNDVLAGVPLPDYHADLSRLLDALATNTDAVIAIGNAPFPPAGLDPWGLPDAVRRAVALAWNASIAAAARRHRAVLVDLYEQWPVAERPDYLGPDGLHPTAGGYRALAEVFAGTLRAEGVV